MARKKQQSAPSHADSRKTRAQEEICPPAIEPQSLKRQGAGSKPQAQPQVLPSTGPRVAAQNISPKPPKDLDQLNRATAIDAVTAPLTSTCHKRLSILQKIIVICIVLTGATLLYMRGSREAGSDSHEAGSLQMVPTRPQRSQAPAGVARISLDVDESRNKSRCTLNEYRRIQPGVADLSQASLSLRTAEAFYLQKDFEKAYAAYNQLRQDLAIGKSTEDGLMDFLQLKMAFCLQSVGDFERAVQIFKMLSQSRYPVIRTVANYHLSLFEMQKQQYLNARKHAYRTIALVSALTFDWQWNLTMQQNCHLLIAESVTKHVLSLCDADKDCPVELWDLTLRSPGRLTAERQPDASPSQMDPFINLSEAELRRLLNCGSEQLRSAVLSPQIEKLEQSAGTEVARFSVICNGASIEELLARFAGRAGLDIQWACDSPSVRKRPVYLCMSAATAQQVLTAAAGCVGLLARMGEEAGQLAGQSSMDYSQPMDCDGTQKTVKIFDPSDYASLSQHLALLNEEAISLWRGFLLTFGGKNTYADASAHFALGLLHACWSADSKPAALAEYKLVANRYPRAPLAPLALLASGRVKLELRDYSGAREDLLLLTEQYPDTGFYDQALLELADATMKAGLLSEAARLYRKIYNLGLSLRYQKASALGAGRCFYEEKDFKNAAKWLTRYINLAATCLRRAQSLRQSGDPAEPAAPQTDRDFSLACLLLGKAYLAQDLAQQACDAFELALTGHRRRGAGPRLTMQEYVETVSALVKAHLKQRHFIEALKLLDNTRCEPLSQRESIELLILEASVLRSMGLADEANTILDQRGEYVLDSQLKAKVFFEQAKCLIAKGDLASARKKLSEAFVLVEPSATSVLASGQTQDSASASPLAEEVGCELADVCLKLGQERQAISICLQLLNSEGWLATAGPPQARIKQRLLSLLATAYRRQKNYDQAALALLGIIK